MTMPPINWDDLNVGNFEFNDSKSFFAKKHLSHESLEKQKELNLINIKMATASLDDHSINVELIEEDKENLRNNYNTINTKLEPETTTECKLEAPTKTVTSSPVDDKTTLADIISKNSDKEPDIKLEILSPIEEVTDETCAANVKVCSDKNTIPSPVTATEKTDPNINSPKLFKSPLSIKYTDVTVKSKKPSNIVCQWSSQKIVRTALTAPSKGAITRPNDLYNYKDVYQRKKDENLRKCLENERKMREFHSRPVPNFKATHKKLELQKVHAVTVPQSPVVLKKSREMMERKMNKLEEIKRKQQPPKFEHRPPVVLKEDPFVPKKSQTVVQQCPFNLHSDRRLLERKQFDVAVQRQTEEKRKQVEIVSKKQTTEN